MYNQKSKISVIRKEKKEVSRRIFFFFLFQNIMCKYYFPLLGITHRRGFRMRRRVPQVPEFRE